jgi:hypothetical protein
MSFLTLSNGTTFCTYDLVTDQFKEHDFTQKIANPITRKHALSEPIYNKVFEPKTFTKTNYVVPELKKQLKKLKAKVQIKCFGMGKRKEKNSYFLQKININPFKPKKHLKCENHIP